MNQFKKFTDVSFTQIPGMSSTVQYKLLVLFTIYLNKIVLTFINLMAVSHIYES